MSLSTNNFSVLREKYPKFFWDIPISDTGDVRNYVLENSFVEKSISDISSLSFITEEIFRIISKVSLIVSELSVDELESLGIPAKSKPFLNINYGSVLSYITRLDFVDDLKGNYKCIEANTCTPFLPEECFVLNDEICLLQNRLPINVGMYDKYKSTYLKAIADCSDYLNIPLENLNIYISSLSKDECYEDFHTVEFITESINSTEKVHVNYISFEDIIVQADEGVYTRSGSKIDLLLIPSYPIEFLLEDIDGINVLNLVLNKKFAILNPPSSYTMQSKALFGIIWGLKDNPDIFNSSEKLFIESYFPATYFSADYFLINKIPYVEKSFFGRSGNSIYIYDENGICIDYSESDLYDDFSFIYQEYIEIPELESNKDIEQNYYLLSSYVLNGNYGGVVARLGSKITDHNCCFLPICLKE